MSNAPLLEVRGLNAWYGESHVLHGVDLDIREGETVTLLGRNGAGKTTTLRAIMGILRRREGTIRLRGQDLLGMPLHRVAQAGLGYVPEERGIFASLNVSENLLLPPTVAEGGMSVDEIYRLFPNLYERRTSQGTKLSGGEQQMLAIARVLRTGARFILLDEPTEGLAPVIIQRIGDVLAELKKRHDHSARGAELPLRPQGRRPLLSDGGRAYGKLVPRPRARRAHGRTPRSAWGVRA